ncbi:complement C1q tumor necrosis factor-related protein 3-like [Periophthalmus magnuspinnatus]|uniref:complement C1q tumor necrosis factor-related protein 3-like n=1 Tax=Periophthalmus magnuspinnatus TaxID=409849 RepID=UPI00145ACF81|nr:complement C1q tumor necrosis factor-related protein 3-like [Periophthalmus magnuspinnatus]
MKLEKELQQTVAFSATLLNSADSQTLGPYNVETTLVYKHVFTNVGNAYNSITGIFTAPVKGAYHFVFFALNNRPTSAEAYLKKNGEAVLMAHETQSYGAGTAGNAVTLILEVGDTVYVTLPANTQLYDNHHRHNTFSGHLLFKLY